MELKNIVDNTRTDKNTRHCYLDIYQNLFSEKRLNAKNILEIGISFGGSIKLWYDFFTNANIYGIDIANSANSDQFNWNDIINKNNIILYTSSDGYNENFFNNNIKNKNINFDIIIDDGDHNIDSMIKFIQLYSQILADDGILIIEDVQYIEWIEILKSNTPDNLKEFITIYDLRSVNNINDDILFVINKSNKN